MPQWLYSDTAADFHTAKQIKNMDALNPVLQFAAEYNFTSRYKDIGASLFIRRIKISYEYQT